MPEDKILLMQQLVHELNEASDAYYNGRPERMTDYEWDQRFDELKQLETETGPEGRARVRCSLAGQDQAARRIGEVG